MKWDDYVIWTDKTACPAASTEAYLRLGLIEEANEVMSVWYTGHAQRTGAEKRKLRGDEPWIIRLKESNAQKEAAQLDEEVGDLLWYAARIVRVTNGLMTFYVNSCPKPEDMAETLNNRNIGTIPIITLARWLCMAALSLTTTPFETLLDLNVQKLEKRLADGTIKGSGER